MSRKLTFKPNQVTKKLIIVLPERARDIIVARYGLGQNREKMTLEGIGNLYGITRERVRQIENHSLNSIRKSEQYEEHQISFKELEEIIRSLGGVVAEEDLLKHLSDSERIQNHIVFLLELGNNFKKQKEDKHLKHRWYIEDELHDKVHKAIQDLYSNLTDEELVTEPEIISRFLEHVKDVSEEYRNEEIARRWLGVAKHIDRNPLGEWGRSTSPNVRVKGMRDYAYLVIRKHGSPMHFREVAEKINEMFGKKAHIATTHNELIKDPRFVLVGRGLYALREWGYETGVVKDVIKSILKKHGPLSRENIMEKVMKERYVKGNTILVNLQDTEVFGKDSRGRYYLKGSSK
ncbi:MAG: sigma factor-like helix-turn-helix DNA-binding protein [Candidatus Campbellbacteria bacterium]|nr:sigma factor-like helix-turn-helix DNA-binding protein [Candidatus Campbellbacteria bacterium]